MNRTSQTSLAPLALAALALAASGCPSSDGSCESSAICGEGSLCFEGRCVAALPTSPLCSPPTVAVPTAAPGVSSPATDLQYQSCQRVVASPVLPSGWVIREGVHAVGTQVTFDVPPGTSSVTIHSQATAAAEFFLYGPTQIPNSVVPTAVTLPNGHLLFDDLEAVPPDARFLPAYYGNFSPWSGSFGVPDTSRFAELALANGEVPPGTWSFTVNDWNAECAVIGDCVPSSPAGTYDITVVARPGPYVSTGSLDLNVYLVGGAPGLTAASAANYPGMARFLSGIGRLLGQAGICLASVTFRDVPSWARTDPRFTAPDIDGNAPCGELPQLFTLAAPVDGVHLFLVDALCQGTDCNSGIIGIDGSIPGPSGLPGGLTSGAAMTLDDIGATNACSSNVDLVACGPDTAAYVAAHEIGHWLGLYHTTEGSGDTFDPLADTGTCSCSECGFGTCDVGFGMAPQDCLADGATCAGGDNLMFWVIDVTHPGVSVGRLTAQQAHLARLNPAVK